MGIYAFLSETIDAYTGLSPAAFLTILSLMAGAYFLVSSFFVHPDSLAATQKSAVASASPTSPTSSAPVDQQPSPPPALMAEPVQMGDMTLEELRAYNGSDRNQPLLVSIKGDVYNVSRGCASPVRDTAHDLLADSNKVDSLLLRRLAMAVQHSRSVVQKGGFYGGKERQMNQYENGGKAVVNLEEMSLRKLKAMYKGKLRRLRNSNNSVLN